MNLHYAAWTVAIALLSLQACSSLPPDAVTYEIGPGPEDLVLAETADGNILVTATAPRGVFLSKLGGQLDPRRNRIRGLTLPDHEIRTLVRYESECDPLALYLVEEPSESSGRPLLYVLNAECDPGDEHDRFFIRGVAAIRVDDWSKFGETVSSKADWGDAFVYPNSIAVTHDGYIYVSNFNSDCLRGCTGDNPEFASPENKTPLEAGKDSIVLWVPGGEGDKNTTGQWITVARDIGGANGLALSENERHLYVSAWHRGVVWRLTRDLESGRFIKKEQICLNSGAQGEVLHPDNLTLTDYSLLYITAQTSKLKAALNLSLSPRISASAKLLRFDTNRDFAEGSCPLAEEIREVEIPRGFNAASTVVPHGERFYLGQIVGNIILVLERRP